MSLTQSDLLFDVTTRLALFVENIKLAQMQEFRQVLTAIDEDLRKLLGRVQYKTLDGLTKAQLNTLILQLRKSQLRVYNAYTEKLLKTFEAFMQLRLEVGAIAYASLNSSFSTGELEEFSEAKAFEYIEEQSKLLPFAPLFGLAAILPSGKTSLWSTIKNAPIPANGLYLIPFVQTFAKSAQANVENTIRKGYANRLSVDEVLAELNGARTVQGNSTVFAKIATQANAVLDTAFAHVDQISSQAITSAIHSRYQWLSVIDNSTTEFCRRHDEKIFRYGAGPVPPAHYRCRSITVPLAAVIGDFSPPTLYAWLKRQSLQFLKEFLGHDVAVALKSGELKAKDFANVVIGKPLQMNRLKSKIGLILGLN